MNSTKPTLRIKAASMAKPDAYASCTYDSPVGELTIAAGNDGIKGLWMSGQKYFGASLDASMAKVSISAAEPAKTSTCRASEALASPPASKEERETPTSPANPTALQHLEAALAWLDDYFADKNPSLDRLTLAPLGSEFRRVIWQLLCEIPLGETRTYGDLSKEAAKRLGKERMSSQAVGGAVGHNPISIIVPCHRVVGANGSLTGYAGGISKKLWLLEHEGAPTKGLFIPKKSTAP